MSFYMADDELKKQVVDYIKENPDKTNRQVAEALDCPKCETFFAIYNMVEEGELEGKGRTWKDKRYSSK